MSDLAIKVTGLGKRFRLHHETNARGYRTLREDLVRIPRRAWAKLRGARDEEFWALQDVSFEVKPGEVVGVIGRNGAGKSTLLKILSRITPPTVGEVELCGRVGSLLEVGTGFHPELTGRENIFLSGAILGMRRPEIRRRFDEIVAFAGVEKFLDTPCKHYSSGMYLRLGFAVAAHLDAEILLVDEVLAVGDAEFQQKCLGKMGAVAKGGRTVLFVSHNLSALRRLCMQGLFMDRSQCVLVGSMNECIRLYIEKLVPMAISRILDHGEIRFERFEFESTDATAPASFGTDKPVTIHIEFVLKQPMPGLRVGFDLVSVDTGEVIFRSFDDDLQARARSAGRHHVCGTIPANLLRAGQYRAVLAAGVHNQRWISRDEITCSFSVENIVGVNSRFNDRRPGTVAPLILWEETG